MMHRNQLEGPAGDKYLEGHLTFEGCGATGD